MTQIQVEPITEELPSKAILRMLQATLAEKEATAAAPPPPYDDPIRREQDEYDYDPPGYDPDAPSEDEDWEDEDEDFVDEEEEAEGQVETVMAPVEPPARPMIAAVLQENLTKALAIVAPYIPSYPPLPILANVLLETTDGCRLAISATDLETSITVYIGSKVEQDGAITIPAKLFKELVGTLSRERVDFRVDAAIDTMHMRCGIQTAELRGIDAKEYPPIKHNDHQCDFMIEAEALLRMLDDRAEMHRPREESPHLDRRLHAPGEGPAVAGRRRWLPAGRRAAGSGLHRPQGGWHHAARRRHQEVAARPASEQETSEVGIKLPDQRNSVSFYLPNIVISTQLLEGRFPDYMSIVPRSFISQVVLYASDTQVALKRAKIFAKDNANSADPDRGPGAFNPGEPAEVTILGKSRESGQTEAMLDAIATGERFEWSFNFQYMLDAIDSYRKDAERIVIDSNGPENPAVIRPEIQPLESVGDCGSMTVIMPMSK